MRLSAGLLVYRRVPRPEVLLGHPGGPLWRRRDLGAWTVPKGAVEPNELPLAAALREFAEETGLSVCGRPRALDPIQQKGGKRVLCWALEGDLDLRGFKPGLFEMEWPPRSGRSASFPELDRIAYFPVEEALERILPAQRPLILEAVSRWTTETRI